MRLASLVGNRIHVIGNSSSGKSTLAVRMDLAALGRLLGTAGN